MQSSPLFSSPMEPSPAFAQGQQVEITSKEEGFDGSWYTATVIRPARTKRRQYYVEYHTITEEEGGSRLLREYVNASNIRPRQPVEEEEEGETQTTRLFQPNEEVDAFYNDGWWQGVVIKVLEGGSRYGVYFTNTRERMEFGFKELRPHMEWLDGSWIKSQDKGKLDPVEVSFDDEDCRGAWFPATALKEIGDGSFLVEYSTLRSGDNVQLKDIVDSRHVRPSPPTDSVCERFDVLKKVDAFYDLAWWSGVITRVLAEDRYCVFLKHQNKEKEFTQSELRDHMEWTDGKWIRDTQKISIIQQNQGGVLILTGGTALSTEPSVQLSPHSLKKTLVQKMDEPPLTNTVELLGKTKIRLKIPRSGADKSESNRKLNIETQTKTPTPMKACDVRSSAEISQSFKKLKKAVATKTPTPRKACEVKETSVRNSTAKEAEDDLIMGVPKAKRSKSHHEGGRSPVVPTFSPISLVKEQINGNPCVPSSVHIAKAKDDFERVMRGNHIPLEPRSDKVVEVERSAVTGSLNTEVGRASLVPKNSLVRHVPSSFNTIKPKDNFERDMSRNHLPFDDAMEVELEVEAGHDFVRQGSKGKRRKSHHDGGGSPVLPKVPLVRLIKGYIKDDHIASSCPNETAKDNLGHHMSGNHLPVEPTSGDVMAAEPSETIGLSRTEVEHQKKRSLPRLRSMKKPKGKIEIKQRKVGRMDKKTRKVLKRKRGREKATNNSRKMSVKEKIAESSEDDAKENPLLSRERGQPKATPSLSKKTSVKAKELKKSGGGRACPKATDSSRDTPVKGKKPKKSGRGRGHQKASDSSRDTPVKGKEHKKPGRGKPKSLASSINLVRDGPDHEGTTSIEAEDSIDVPISVLLKSSPVRTNKCVPPDNEFVPNEVSTNVDVVMEDLELRNSVVVVCSPNQDEQIIPTECNTGRGDGENEPDRVTDATRQEDEGAPTICADFLNHNAEENQHHPVLLANFCPPPTGDCIDEVTLTGDVSMEISELQNSFAVVEGNSARGDGENKPDLVTDTTRHEYEGTPTISVDFLNHNAEGNQHHPVLLANSSAPPTGDSIDVSSEIQYAPDDVITPGDVSMEILELQNLLAVVEDAYVQEKQTTPAENTGTISSSPRQGHRSLPFVKSPSLLPLWESVDSMIALHSIPQNPHFLPLEQLNEELREGRALGCMANFASLMDKTRTTKLDEPRSSLEEKLGALDSLEELGFTVGPIRSRLEELLQIKDKHMQFEDASRAVEMQIIKEKHKKGRLEVQIKELQKALNEMNERLQLFAMEKEMKGCTVAELERKTDEFRQNIQAVELDFDRLVAASW